MTDPLHPRLVRELLLDFQAAVAQVAGREAALARTHAAALLAAKRRSTARKEAAQMSKSDEQSGIMARSDSRQEAAVLKYEARRSWIARATRAAHAGLAERIRNAKDRQVGMRQVETQRTLEDARERWERSRQDHREFTQAVGADLDETAATARAALKVLRSFHPWFSAMLRKGKLVRCETPVGEGLSREALKATAAEHLAKAQGQLASLRRNPLAAFFRWVPLVLVLTAIVGIFAWLAWQSPDRAASWQSREQQLILSLLSAVVAHTVVALLLLGPVRRLAVTLQSVRTFSDAAAAASEAGVTALGEQLKQRVTAQSEGLSETLRGSDATAQERMQEGRRLLEEKAARLPAKAEALHHRELESIARDMSDGVATLQRSLSGEESAREEEHTRGIADADAARSAGMEELAIEWEERVKPLHQRLLELDAEAAARFPEWSDAAVDAWTPPAEGVRAVPFARVRVEVADLAGGLPESGRFKFTGPLSFDVPLALGFPDRGSLLVEGEGSAAALAFNEIILRVLANAPVGRASFTLIDPVGLGRDHAGLMHLGDYEDTLIHGRIWTQTSQIEERLAEINEHIEKVIQMYLRNEYATLDDYNRQAGTVAEKERFVVISGFPAGFSETALKRLHSIAATGGRCGVYLLVHRDPRQPVDAVTTDALAKACLHLVPAGPEGLLRITSHPAGADTVLLSAPPQGELESRLVHRIGKASVDSNRVQVPFSVITPAADQWWQESTADELRVPIGRSGAKKFQMLALGKGTRQHVLVAGKTGSGKSTLFHVMITNLALHCSPQEVEFYLVDFKKGVEFKCYGTKRLPHARVVAMESDREFGLSVLHRVDEELRVRGELFRKAGAQDLAGYRKASGLPMPRTLLVIDEFQEFFTEDDAVAQSASLLLDRIVRQGRAFGIHVILGSQTLGGAYTLARATLGQMVVRIALQCNEADSYLIMDDDNPAPRLLTRPGEGIYNDNAGSLAANSPFQTVWLPEDERGELLDQVSALAETSGMKATPPVVFEGNAPADLEANEAVRGLLATPPTARPEEARAWLGEPNSIKEPTHASFTRRSGSHLLVVGQADERVATMLEIAAYSLSLAHPPGEARFVIFDGTGALKRVAGLLPHEVKVVGPAAVADACTELAAELDRRIADGEGEQPPVFVVIHGLQRFKKLRQEEDFLFSMDDGPAGPSPAKVFGDLASQGAPAGIHLLVGTDTWNNVSRWIPRKTLAEFEMRVLFQMSANDSASLIDSPAAGSLGLQRALLYHDALGIIETFRPYAEPDPTWWR